MLTPTQKRLLEFIDGYIQRHGFGPSTDEMRTALGKSSKGSIGVLVAALEERGFVRRLSKRARAIEVIRQPVTSPLPRDPRPVPGGAALLPVMGVIE